MPAKKRVSASKVYTYKLLQNCIFSTFSEVIKNYIPRSQNKLNVCKQKHIFLWKFIWQLYAPLSNVCIILFIGVNKTLSSEWSTKLKKKNNYNNNKTTVIIVYLSSNALRVWLYYQNWRVWGKLFSLFLYLFFLYFCTINTL